MFVCLDKNLYCTLSRTSAYTQSLCFVGISLGRIIDKLAIYWQNFAQFELQLRFTFRVRLFFNFNAGCLLFTMLRPIAASP